jgi:hypothetical protein
VDYPLTTVSDGVSILNSSIWLATPTAVPPYRPGFYGQGALDFQTTVNPKGGVMWVQFEYGTSKGYGSRSPESQELTGNTDVTVKMTVTRVRARTLYNYRADILLPGQSKIVNPSPLYGTNKTVIARPISGI